MWGGALAAHIQLVELKRTGLGKLSMIQVVKVKKKKKNIPDFYACQLHKR